MTWDEAIEFMEAFPLSDRERSLSRLQEFVEALAIVASVEPGASVAAAHDILFFGGASGDGACPYTREQLARLGQLGVFVEEDSWGKYT